MSYARFGWDGSDVYIYLDVGGYLSCCACRFHPEIREHFETTDAMIEHLERHVEAGDTVPVDCFERLRADALENDAWILAGAPDDD